MSLIAPAGRMSFCRITQDWATTMVLTGSFGVILMLDTKEVLCSELPSVPYRPLGLNHVWASMPALACMCVIWNTTCSLQRPRVAAGILCSVASPQLTRRADDTPLEGSALCDREAWEMWGWSLSFKGKRLNHCSPTPMGSSSWCLLWPPIVVLAHSSSSV